MPAFTLSKRIVRKDVARFVLRALHADIRAGLAPSGAPSWVAERMEEFAEREALLPFVKAAKGKSEDGSIGGYLIGTGVSKDEGMDEVGHRFQDFYHEIEDQLVKRKWKGRRSFGRGLGFQHHHTNGSISSWSENTDIDEKASIAESAKEDGDETEKESDVEDRQEDEMSKRIRDVIEAVERTLCCVFYDRFVTNFSL